MVLPGSASSGRASLTTIGIDEQLSRLADVFQHSVHHGGGGPEVVGGIGQLGEALGVEMLRHVGPLFQLGEQRRAVLQRGARSLGDDVVRVLPSRVLGDKFVSPAVERA